MQCPNCGFQNIPGSEVCGACSSSLVDTTSRACVRPPRARDRRFHERILWSIGKDQRYARINRRLEWLQGLMFTARYSGFVGRVVSTLPLCLAVLVSVIPGLGHLLIIHDFFHGVLLFFTGLAALVLAVATIQTRLADISFYIAVALSMYSVYAMFIQLGRRDSVEQLRIRRAIGVGLIVIALYFGGYTVLRIVMMSRTPIILTEAPIQAANIEPGDSIIFRDDRPLRRGDIVAVNARFLRYSHYQIRGGMSIGRIVGFPGDTITVSDRLYINGVPLNVQRPENDTAAQGQTVLGKNEYWVLPENTLMIDHDQYILTTGFPVNRLDIEGHAVAITDPPAHRRWIR